MRHFPTLRYSIGHCPHGTAPSNYAVYDHVSGRRIEGWFTYDEAQAEAARLSGDEPEDEPEFIDADDRAASAADDKFQLKQEWA